MSAILLERSVRETAAAVWPAAPADVLEARAASATWSIVAEPGDGVAGRAVSLLGPVAALRAAESDASAPGGIGAREWAQALDRWRPRLQRGASLLAGAFEQARRRGLVLRTPDDPSWPGRLADLGDHAPFALWMRGDPALLERLSHAVAIVGARAASGYGEQIAAELAADLAADAIPIVSGAAYGIDGAAHRAALHVDGPTIAVLAGGADRVYPAGHANLIGRIAETGLVLSEVPPGTPPTKFRFLLRNRIIACLAAGTVVVEAGWRSGSLNTASHAATLGRPLGAVPGSVLSATSAGCHRLLREFDAVCITGPDDVRELVGIDGTEETARELPPADRRATRVGDALSTGAWRTTDELARRSGLAPADVEVALGLLALEGRAERQGEGWRLIQ